MRCDNHYWTRDGDHIVCLHCGKRRLSAFPKVKSQKEREGKVILPVKAPKGTPHTFSFV